MAKELKQETKIDEKKIENKKVETVETQSKEDINKSAKKEVESKTEETKKVEEKKAPVKTEVKKKEIAIANAYSLRISPKASYSICKVIRNKTPDMAVQRLLDAASGKRAIPMAGMEVPHQKGKGLAGGRFPKNACLEIAEIIKQVKANAIANGIDNPVITIAQANRAAAPFRRGGRRGKRTHLHLEVRDRNKLLENKKGAKK